MGLNNWIELHIIDEDAFGPVPEWFERRMCTAWNSDLRQDRPLYYRPFGWRNCYGIRAEIVKLLGIDYEDHWTEVSLDKFEALCNHLLTCYNEEWWREHERDSLWKWSASYEWNNEEMRDEQVSNGVGDRFWRDLAIAFRLLECLRTRAPNSFSLFFYNC